MKFKRLATTTSIAATLSLSGCVTPPTYDQETYTNLVQACDESPAPGQKSVCESLGINYSNAINLCSNSLADWANSWAMHAANACDVASIAYIPNTAPGKSPVPYNEAADGFDLELRNSLKKLDRVVVDMSGAGITVGQLDHSNTSQSPRIAFWLSRVDSTGGEIAKCEAGTEGGILSLVEFALGLFINWSKSYVTYKPASDFNAKIVYTLPPGDEKGTGRVTKIEFVKRNSTGNDFNCES